MRSQRFATCGRHALLGAVDSKSGTVVLPAGKRRPHDRGCGGARLEPFCGEASIPTSTRRLMKGTDGRDPHRARRDAAVRIARAASPHSGDDELAALGIDAFVGWRSYGTLKWNLKSRIYLN